MGGESEHQHGEEVRRRRKEAMDSICELGEGEDEKPTDKKETADNEEKDSKPERASDTTRGEEGDRSEVQDDSDGQSSEEEDNEREQSPDDQDKTEYPSGIKLAFILLAMSLSTLLLALDETIIAPALGTITAEFHGVGDIGWYGAAYLLTTTALQPMYGTLYKLFNVKCVYLVAIVLFEIGSLLCAVAPSSMAFIVGRAVAGLGTAGLFSGAIVVLFLTMPSHRRPLAFGLISAMFGVASVAGPLLGGAFTANVTWRWCFYVNLPIGGFTFAIVFFLVRLRVNTAQKSDQTIVARIRQVDITGTAFFIPGMLMLLIALEWGGNKFPWDSAKIIGLLVGAGLVILVFVGVQVWKGDEGTLPPRLFRNRSIVCAVLFNFFFGAAFVPLIDYLSLYFQAIQGVSAVKAGVQIIPFLLATVVSSILTGGIISIIGHYNPVIAPSMLVFTVGAGLITTFGVHTPWRMWFGYEVLTGLGMGAGFQASLLVVQTVLPQDWVPVGTACVQFFQALGGAVFVAVSQTVFQNGLIEQIRRDDIGIDPRVFMNSGASEVRQVLERMGRSDAVEAVLEAYMTGLRNTYYISVAAAACAFLASLGFKDRSVKKEKGKMPAVPV